MTVLLTNGTVGQVVVKEGDKVTVSLHDENGRPIDVTGIIKAILEED